MSITIDDIRKRWSGPSRPKFAKGILWDEGAQCGCAQGDILLACGVPPKEFPPQDIADKEVAKRLGITLFHSVLLRVVNDSQAGCPEKVLQFTDDGLGSVLGPNWRVVIAFGEHVDNMTDAAGAAARAAARAAAWDAARAAAWAAAWDAARAAARAAAGAAAWDAAWDAAGAAAWAAAWDAAWDAAGAAAGAAAGECVGISHLKTPPFFLPMFGITDVPAFVEAANKRWRD